MAGNKKLTLIYNAKIYAFHQEDFTWMLFDNVSGYINTLGRKHPPLTDKSLTCTIDLQGRRVLPGFHDAHIHAGLYGLSLTKLKLYECQSIDDLKQRLLTYAKDNPDVKWIQGNGWEQDRLGRYPDKDDLDDICPDRPVILSRVCGHIAVVNTEALRLAGIDRDTRDLEGGKIVRYPEGHPKGGECTGIIEEIVDELFGKFLIPTKLDKSSAIKAAIKQCLQFGITSIHTLEGYNTWDIFYDLADQGQLDIRVFYVPYWETRGQGKLPKPGENKGKLLSCDRIKIFSDGALGACTAAISKPYKGSDNNKGLLHHTQTELNQIVSDATSLGYRLEIHAIGDVAADVVLTSLKAGNITREKRPIIVHCQILRDDIIEKMKSLGVIASIQPQFVPTDSRWVTDLLPTELLTHAYSWKTLFDKGIRCCGGSDAPVENPQPLRGIYDAIFRYTDTRGSHQKTSFRPEECLSVEEAITLYTIGGAFATRREHDLGQLLPGYQADFVVLESNNDPIHYPEEFCTASINQVWVAGIRRV